MGIEKVIPKLEDVSHFLEILARTATGQKLTTYTNFINGPRRKAEIDGPREVHVVILDNGRSAMLADPVMREALYCIRCGACLNVCPIYRRIGGHAYQLDLSGTDRIDHQSESFRQRGGIPAVRVHAVRRVQRHLSRQDRHPANPAPSALEGKHGQASAQVAAQDRAGAARSAALREDGAISADDSRAWKVRRVAAEAILARRLSAPDAGTVRATGRNIATSHGRVRISGPSRIARQAERGRASQNDRERKRRARRRCAEQLAPARMPSRGAGVALCAAGRTRVGFARELEDVGGSFSEYSVRPK